MHLSATNMICGPPSVPGSSNFSHGPGDNTLLNVDQRKWLSKELPNPDEEYDRGRVRDVGDKGARNMSHLCSECSEYN